MFSGRPHARRLYCRDVWRQPVSIPQVNLVADLNDAVLRPCRVDFSPAMVRRVERHNPAPHCLGARCYFDFLPCQVMPSHCVHLFAFPHFIHPITSLFSMQRLKVLLVEDDDDARALYVYMLASAGYRVNAVSNGLEALADIQVNRPDVVVTDILMPVLSGLDLIVAVRSDNELTDLPVVAITSFGENFREQARAAGAADAIDKPTEIERMREVIESVLSRPRLKP
jgi:CheY-like chemotaxis protein